jgi:hypothetical protein
MYDGLQAICAEGCFRGIAWRFSDYDTPEH